MAHLRQVITGDRRPTELETQLHVALDNMPGALAYTDDNLGLDLETEFEIDKMTIMISSACLR